MRMAVEWGPNGRVIDEFEQTWGFPMESNLKPSCTSTDDTCSWVKDKATVFTALQVVDNNNQQNIGGGGVTCDSRVRRLLLMAQAHHPLLAQHWQLAAKMRCFLINFRLRQSIRSRLLIISPSHFATLQIER